MARLMTGGAREGEVDVYVNPSHAAAMQTLEQALSGLARDGDDHVITAPEPWAQGRTLYGGMTAVLCYAAAMRDHAEPAPLRSAQFAFVGPASGELRLRSEILRKGRSATVIGVDCRNAQGVAARATLVFGSARESAVAHDNTPPMPVPPPEECAPFHGTSKALPGFLGRFEYRLAAGARPFERGDDSWFAVWVRFRDGGAADPVATLLAIADATPCAAITQFPRFEALSTMTWTVDLHQPLPRDDGWVLIRSASEAARDGYVLQDMRLYTRDGTPLVSARQVVAIFA